MSHTIFFSWQADTSTRDGRNFIERALQQALDRIATDAKIEEAVREGLELDRDTKGVPGSPPIVDTIFRKIDSAALFVPDLTFVGKRLDNRPTPNPNVLIEYGWALKSLGYSRIVAVMNTALGEPTPETMPFDMRHLRNPICYNLPENANEETRKLEREKLSHALMIAIRTVLSSEDFKAMLPKPPSFVSAEPKDGASCFLEANEPLVTPMDVLGRQSHALHLPRGAHIYLRLMPTQKVKKFSPLELKKAATEPYPRLRPMGTSVGLDWGQNRHGFVVVDVVSRKTNEAFCAVQLFASGEIWSIDAISLEGIHGRSNYLSYEFEEQLAKALSSYRDFLTSALGLSPPFRWIVGMTGLEGRQIVFPPPPPGRSRLSPAGGRCSVSELSEEGILGVDDDPASVLASFFKSVWEHFGIDRASILG